MSTPQVQITTNLDRIELYPNQTSGIFPTATVDGRLVSATFSITSSSPEFVTVNTSSGRVDVLPNAPANGVFLIEVRITPASLQRLGLSESPIKSIPVRILSGPAAVPSYGLPSDTDTFGVNFRPVMVPLLIRKPVLITTDQFKNDQISFIPDPRFTPGLLANRGTLEALRTEYPYDASQFSLVDLASSAVQFYTLPSVSPTWNADSVRRFIPRRISQLTNRRNA